MREMLRFCGCRLMKGVSCCWGLVVDGLAWSGVMMEVGLGFDTYS
jgi:hypothetical protein